MAIADREKALEAALAQIEKQHGKDRARAIAEAARTWWRDLQPEATDGGRP